MVDVDYAVCLLAYDLRHLVHLPHREVLPFLHLFVVVVRGGLQLAGPPLGSFGEVYVYILVVVFLLLLADMRFTFHVAFPFLTRPADLTARVPAVSGGGVPVVLSDGFGLPAPVALSPRQPLHSTFST